MSTVPVTADWIAVDWGTTNLRAWAMDASGRPVARAESQSGMASLQREEYEPALLDLVGDWLATDRRTLVLACGMVGARQGWTEAAYRTVPCPPLGDEPPAQPPAKDRRLNVRIIPGLRQNAPPDVMRGEETQIAGVLARRGIADGVICMPGTHSKWVQMRGGQIETFSTAMTGELFDLITTHSVLRHSTGQGWHSETFSEAVADALKTPGLLSTGLFGVRAASLLHGVSGAKGRSRISGLLIGTEIASVREWMPVDEVTVIGADALAGHYQHALKIAGYAAQINNGAEVTLAGLKAAHALIGENTE